MTGQKVHGDEINTLSAEQVYIMVELMHLFVLKH
jgi:hypothetical protein